jgi:mannose/fructose/N-acetylgalactosamine-specific phosphotransferase system component IIC
MKKSTKMALLLGFVVVQIMTLLIIGTAIVGLPIAAQIAAGFRVSAIYRHGVRYDED